MSLLKLRSAGLVGLLSVVLTAAVVVVVAGLTPAYALPVSGSLNTALGWGLNFWGQLGDGTTTSRGTPGVIPELGLNVTAVAGGQSFGVALRNDATVWTWGLNDQGQLGDGTVWHPTPLQVPNLPAITQISAGLGHVLALGSDGTVWAWGANDQHQVSQGPEAVIGTPTAVAGITGIVQISAGDDFSLALDNNGDVWAWGANDLAQQGIGSTAFNPYPAQVQDLTAVVQIAAGSDGSLALRSDNTVWTWGLNLHLINLLPKQVAGLPIGVSLIAAGGGDFFAVIGNNFEVWSWGNNADGRLGDGTTTNRSTPRPLFLSRVTEIVAAGGHTAAVKFDGTLWTWGQNISGELGINSTKSFVATPTQVPGLSGTTDVSMGRQHTLAVATQLPQLHLGSSRSDQVGQFLSVQLSLTGGLPPYTWTANDIPPGLSLNPSTGVISGTPTTIGGYSPQVSATDQVGHTGVASLGWSIMPVHINVPNLDGTTQGSARYALNAVGLTLGHVSRSRLCNGPIGTVIHQSPAPWTSVLIGSAVNITIEAGPPPGQECP
jgi:alpha-tubulin suppressor-like RCC1 family protein